MASSRRKSCTACVRAKRRCDLSLPACQRCLTRGTACKYPWAEIDPIASSWGSSVSVAEQGASVTRYSTSIPILQSPWGDAGINIASCLPFNSPTSISRPLSPGMPSLFDDLIGQGGITYPLDLECSPPPSSGIQYAIPPLPSDIDPPYGPITTGSVFQAGIEYAARRLAEQPRALASSGQTVFIHHTQVAASKVLQDALAACALHALRNPANAALVRTEVARRAARLVSAMEAAEPTTHPVKIDLLPPVQALLVYQCIRLFSGDVGEPARAERDEDRLRAWVGRLREQVRPLGDSMGNWACWVREESVRRTVLVAEILVGVYAFLKQGWDQAEARVWQLGFTAQTALWEARSGPEWRAMWAQGPRLEVVLENWGRAMEGAVPDDMDDLGIIIHATYLGLEPLEEWLGGKKTALLRWGLRP
ncbi:hypothetical protein B0O99DRAFT_684032 [Bisporella sp. PMI_857]|nr:hypothetical protein B0O99DRAFT_684032 [Bisporella sp. PMI_857]